MNASMALPRVLHQAGPPSVPQAGKQRTCVPNPFGTPSQTYLTHTFDCSDSFPLGWYAEDRQLDTISSL